MCNTIPKMYILLETVCNFRVGSRVGSSGIQRDRMQNMYVLLKTLCNFKMGSRVGSSGIQRDRTQKMYVLLETICNFRVGSRMGSNGIQRDRSCLEGWRAFDKVVFWSRLLVERRSFCVGSRNFLNPCKENCVSQFMRRCWQAC